MACQLPDYLKMNDLKNKPIIIITGSSGFIGKAIATRLYSQFHIIGFDQKITEKSNHAENFEVDISSINSISQALELVKIKHGSRIASVVHLAAYYSFSEEESPQYQKITVQGTKNLLTALKNYDVGQFIFSSTMLIHKPVQKGEKISETSPVEPSWAYPASKVAAENILKESHAHIPLVTLRIAGVYDDRCHSVPIANQIMRIYEKHLSSHFFPGDPSKGQAFIHLNDLVDAIDTVIQKRAQLPRQLDVLLGEPEVVSYDQLQDKIGQLIYDQHWDTLKVPSWFAKSGAWLQHHTPLIRTPFVRHWMIDFADDHYDLDITHAQELLNWQPKHRLKKTLPFMIDALKKDPLQWYKENKLEAPNTLSRTLGRMQGDDIGFEVPSNIYKRQLAMLNWMTFLWGLWLVFDSVTHTTNAASLRSEVLSGVFVMAFSALAHWTLWQWPRWLNALIGIWILFAPLAFWTPSSASYSVANLLGLLIILCSSYQPTKYYFTIPEALNIPENWDYNPSSWRQRFPIITLAFLGFFIARYMAAFQLGHINTIWDPVFDQQTATILKSDISKNFPVSDAGLGAFSYLLDAISGIIGDQRRWRTMPWIVILFGLMIIPPGVTSIVLVILQPIGVGAWCFLCLLTAFIMLLMVAPALDEVVATVQFLRQSHKQGKPFWRTFLRGIPVTTEELIELSPKDFTVKPQKLKPSIPWSLVACSILSAILMAAPALLHLPKSAADIIHISSALFITFSVIALSEVGRPVRILNVATGLILAINIGLSSELALSMKWGFILSSLAIILLSLSKGQFRKHFGTYDKIAQWSLLASFSKRKGVPS